MEYSSRNRHCLVDMEFTIDDTCLEDSLMQPADPTQSDTATQSAQADRSDKPKSSGALAALVKVGIVPEFNDKYFSCHCLWYFWLQMRFCIKD